MRGKMFFIPACFASFVIILLISPVSAFSTASSQGEISNLVVKPRKPYLSEELKIETTVRNPTDQERNYKLKLLISGQGKVKEMKEVSVVLGPKEELNLGFSHTPSSIGTFTIVAKLTDKSETTVYSRNMRKVKVLSEIGPFDLSIDPLSGRARTNSEIPISHRFKNMGTLGSEVLVHTVMDCPSAEDRSTSFSVFLSGNKTTQHHLTTLSTCPSTGLHEITSELFLNGQSWVQATSQIFLTEKIYPLSMDFPDEIEVGRGNSTRFEVVVHNEGNKSIHRGKLKAQGIPSNWYSTSPKSISVLEGKGAGLFLVSISVPKEIDRGKLPIKFIFGAEETLVTGKSSLNITGREEVEKGGPAPSIYQNLYTSFSKYGSFVLVGLVVIFVFLYWRKIRRGEKQNRNEKLEKIKNEVGI